MTKPNKNLWLKCKPDNWKYIQGLLHKWIYTMFENIEGVLNIDVSSQNLATAEHNPLALCARHIWGEHKAYDFEKLYLPFTKQQYSGRRISFS